MKQEQIIEKVKQFYREKQIPTDAMLPNHMVCARMVLFVEWLQEQNVGAKQETWQDIFDAQPK